VYQYDVVPRLPPRTVDRFAHFGREYHGTKRDAWRPRGVAARQVLAATVAVPLATLAFLAEQLLRGRRVPLPGVARRSPAAELRRLLEAAVPSGAVSVSGAKGGPRRARPPRSSPGR
jgi:hypothetical protein